MTTPRTWNWFPASLRWRLQLLVLLAVLPALGLILYNAYEQRSLGLARAGQDTLRLVRLAGVEHDRLIESARELLVTLAQVGEVRERQPAACRDLFASLLQTYRVYVGVLLAEPHGRIIAAGDDQNEYPGLAATRVFQEATNRLAFSLGHYRVKTNTYQAVMDMAYPVLDKQGTLAGVLVLSLSLDWLYWLHDKAGLPENSSFSVFDRHALTVARYPDPDHRLIGQRLPITSEDTLHAMTNEVSWASRFERERTGVITGRDGIRRLYGYARLGDRMQENALVLTVGIPVAFAHGASDLALRRNLVFLAVVAALAMAAAWLGSEVFLLRRVRSLLQATESLQKGDLRTRLGPPSPRGELDRLAVAFDSMAGALEKQFAERDRAEQALQSFNQRLEQRIVERTQELERSNQDLEQFAYVASHDLQEPLRMVTSYLNLLQNRYADSLDQDAREFIGYAVEGAERMRQLINDLLVYSRVQTRGQPFEPVDCNDVVDQVLNNLKVAIDESGAEVRRERLPTVMGDRSQLTQLFQNLLSNAIKFRADRPPRVELTARRQEVEWQFSVHDNGIGIAPKQFERIFVVFQRLHARERYPGTGIGLSICKKIVERHGGRIWVESVSDQGSTFHFTLPLREAPEPADA